VTNELLRINDVRKGKNVHVTNIMK